MNENKSYNKCQSCAMLIKNDANKGTEIDQVLSKKYCKYCYQNGTFIEPNITLKEMQEKCTKNFKTEHQLLWILFGRKYINSISKLTRWNKENN